MADETGLGKTHVAKEVIALAVEHLQQVDHVHRIDIILRVLERGNRRSEHSQAQDHRLGEPELRYQAESPDHKA